jgi:hypothetical protein
MHIVVTLAERDYIHGALVLLNSLIRNGFDGCFVIGYRNATEIPLRPLRALREFGARVHWIELDTPLHFTNYKPTFMREVLDRYPEAIKITYYDPDIVMNCPFDWIASWCDGGPAVCGDVNWMMPAQHPTRRQWLELTGMQVHNHLDIYFNGGFLSVRRRDRNFLQLWQELIERWSAAATPLDTKGDIGDWRKGGRWLLFFTPDQDALNIAMMVWNGPVVTLGPDVMSFAAFGELPHAIGSNKPWRRRYLLEALQGRPPRHADKVYWAYADSPKSAFSKHAIRLKRIELKLASFIGRFYSQ